MNNRTCSGFAYDGDVVYAHDAPFDRDTFPSWCFQPGRDKPGRILRCKACDSFRKTKIPPSMSIWKGLHMVVGGVEYNNPSVSGQKFDSMILDELEQVKEDIVALSDIEEEEYEIPLDEIDPPAAVVQYERAIGPEPPKRERPRLPDVKELSFDRAALSEPAVVSAAEAPDEGDEEFAPESALANSHEYRASADLVELWKAVVNGTKFGGRPPANIIFFGPSGSGKSQGARFLAEMVNLPFTKVDAASMTDPEAWFGTREVIVEQGVSVTKYVPSELVHALQRPGMVFVDEVNRVDDEHRNVWLPLTDGTGEVTNPLTGEVVRRHPHCFIVMAGNRGMQFTGTSAVDPAFTSRAYIVEFDYLEEEVEREVLQEATGCDPDTAYVFARFAKESRDKAMGDPDFVPISTREAIMACDAVAQGLSRDLAAKYAIMNASSSEGAGSSVRGIMEDIWNGVRLTRKEVEDDDEELLPEDTGWHCPQHDKFKIVPAGVSTKGVAYDEFRSCPVAFCEEAESRKPKKSSRKKLMAGAQVTNSGKTCTSCGTINAPGQNSFCSSCGAVLP